MLDLRAILALCLVWRGFKGADPYIDSSFWLSHRIHTPGSHLKSTIASPEVRSYLEFLREILVIVIAAAVIAVVF